MENIYLANWKITEIDSWHRDYLKLLLPAQIQFDLSGGGTVQFGDFKAQLVWKIPIDVDVIEFAFKGNDKGADICGRGWATLIGNERTGHVYFQQGDNSNFNAVRMAKYEDN